MLDRHLVPLPPAGLLHAALALESSFAASQDLSLSQLGLTISQLEGLPK